MDASLDDSEQQSSFGIKKIVDCIIEEGGRQRYKVKWEPTWEPAENLAGCQHLINKFWSYINKVKEQEEEAHEYKKKMRLDDSINNGINIDQNFERLSDDEKAEVQRLIARASVTSVGNQVLLPPSSLNIMGMPGSPSHTNSQTFPQQSSHMMAQGNHGMQMPSPSQMSLSFGSQNMADHQNATSPSQKGKFGAFRNKSNNSTPKSEPDGCIDAKDGANSKSVSMSSYVENFNNPYVKIIIVCRICNKEQPSKFVENWRQHYMTHSDQKPHKCPRCSNVSDPHKYQCICANRLSIVKNF